MGTRTVAPASAEGPPDCVADTLATPRSLSAKLVSRRERQSRDSQIGVSHPAKPIASGPRQPRAIGSCGCCSPPTSETAEAAWPTQGPIASLIDYSFLSLVETRVPFPPRNIVVTGSGTRPSRWPSAPSPGFRCVVCPGEAVVGQSVGDRGMPGAIGSNIVPEAVRPYHGPPQAYTTPAMRQSDPNASAGHHCARPVNGVRAAKMSDASAMDHVPAR